jgi:hypothetical protein
MKLQLKKVTVEISDEVFHYNNNVHYVKFPLTYTISFEYNSGLIATYECHTDKYLQRPLDFNNLDVTYSNGFEYQGHHFNLVSVSHDIGGAMYEEAVKLLSTQVKDGN